MAIDVEVPKSSGLAISYQCALDRKSSLRERSKIKDDSQHFTLLSTHLSFSNTTTTSHYHHKTSISHGQSSIHSSVFKHQILSLHSHKRLQAPSTVTMRASVIVSFFPGLAGLALASPVPDAVPDHGPDAASSNNFKYCNQPSLGGNCNTDDADSLKHCGEPRAPYSVLSLC